VQELGYVAPPFLAETLINAIVERMEYRCRQNDCGQR
jgi:hypothetical protein